MKNRVIFHKDINHCHSERLWSVCTPKEYILMLWIIDYNRWITALWQIAVWKIKAKIILHNHTCMIWRHIYYYISSEIMSYMTSCFEWITRPRQHIRPIESYGWRKCFLSQCLATLLGLIKTKCVHKEIKKSGNPVMVVIYLTCGICAELVCWHISLG